MCAATIRQIPGYRGAFRGIDCAGKRGGYGMVRGSRRRPIRISGVDLEWPAGRGRAGSIGGSASCQGSQDGSAPNVSRSGQVHQKDCSSGRTGPTTGRPKVPPGKLRAANAAGLPPSQQSKMAPSSSEPASPHQSLDFRKRTGVFRRLWQRVVRPRKSWRRWRAKKVPAEDPSALQAEAESLEEILRNPARPKNLVAVKKSERRWLRPQV